MKSLDEYLVGLHKALDAIDRNAFECMVDELKRVHREDKCLFVAGNGGSAATASHIINDVVKGIAWPAKGRETLCRPFRAIGLADCVPLMTALANDNAYDYMFAGQLEALGRPGDALMLISGSGNSGNVVAAAQVAKDKGITLIGLTGFDGGRLGSMADIHVHVAHDSMAQIEDVHLIMQHAFVEILKAALHEPTGAAS